MDGTPNTSSHDGQLKFGTLFIFEKPPFNTDTNFSGAAILEWYKRKIPFPAPYLW